MKKIILLFLAILTSVPVVAQENTSREWSFRSRVLQVNQGDVAAFEKAVAKKTEMYNSQERQSTACITRLVTLLMNLRSLKSSLCPISRPSAIRE